MSRESKYLVYAIEYYRFKKGLSGRQVAELFEQHDVYRLILDNYYLYHIENPDHMVADVDFFIETGCTLA